MIKKFENSLSMAEDIILIDKESFKSIPYSPEVLKQKIIKNKNYELYIYYEKKIPIGYIGLLFVNNLHYDGVWIDLIAVREKYRHNGYGKKLISFVESKVMKKKLEIITGLVRNDNVSSATLFEKLGFKDDEIGYKLYTK